MSDYRSMLVGEIATAMNDINDLGVTSQDFAEEAMLVLERHGLDFSIGDREETIFRMDFALTAAQDREARHGNYCCGFEVFAKAIVECLEDQHILVTIH